MAQTKREIGQLLDEAGIRPLKRYGQHFLIDGNLMNKLVASAEIAAEDVVLEVGVGTGSLTEMLLEKAGHLVAVEIDRGLHALVRERLAEFRTADPPQLTLLHRDVLETKSRITPEVTDAIVSHRQRLGGDILLVANLPYNVATPLVIDLLMGEIYVRRMCFTVQAEVADRFVAEPGSKDFGPVSVYAQTLASVRRVATVPPEAFWPRPQVDSAMMRFDVNSDLVTSTGDTFRKYLRRVVQAGFAHRRKTLKYNLKHGLASETTFELLEKAGRWDLSLRPEMIPAADWVAMARLLAEHP